MISEYRRTGVSERRDVFNYEDIGGHESGYQTGRFEQAVGHYADWLSYGFPEPAAAADRFGAFSTGAAGTVFVSSPLQGKW
jgi:hypothetical protein